MSDKEIKYSTSKIMNRMKYSSILCMKVLLSIVMLAVTRIVFAGELVKTEQVMYFPAGIHRLAEIKSDIDHFVIKGDGSGVTILEIPGGITITGKEPRLSGFTLKGYKNRETGITLKNNYRALVQDVEIQGYKLGLLSLCEFGERQWLHTYRDLYVYEGPGGSMRSYNPEIKGIELRYIGEKTKKGGWKPDGGFSNTHTFYGGRIAVPGTPLLIDGPSATAMFGTYIDMSDAPVYMSEKSSGLQLFGVHLDRNRRARFKKLPALQLGNPKYNKVMIYGSHTGLMKYELIVDNDGRPVNSKLVHIERKY